MIDRRVPEAAASLCDFLGAILIDEYRKAIMNKTNKAATKMEVETCVSMKEG